MCCFQSDVFLRVSDFASVNICQNKFLTGRFRLLLDRTMLLEYGIEWSTIEGGGFIINIPNFQMADDTVIVVQFY